LQLKVIIHHQAHQSNGIDTFMALLSALALALVQPFQLKHNLALAQQKQTVDDRQANSR
jgi:hypothetical protein